MPGITWDLFVRGEQRVEHAFKSISAATKDAGVTSSNLGKAWGGLKTAGGLAAKASLGVAGALGAAAVAAVSMTDEVIGLNLQVAKAKVVFGDSFKAVDRQLSRTASNFGITRIEAIGLAGTFADSAKQQGFATKAAAEMSLKFVDLAGRVKLLSAGKLDAAGASEALSAAFRGEFDSLQQVVPAISAARVEELAANIQKKEGKRLTEDQAKTLAVLQIVQGGVKTSNALLATSEGEKATQIEKARTKMREQWQMLQQKLLPALATLWGTVADEVNPALDDFGAWLESPEGKKNVQDWTKALAEMVGVMADLARMTDDVAEATRDATIYAQKAWLQVGKAVVEMKASIYESLSDLPGGLGKPFEEGAKKARAAADRIQERIDALDTKAAEDEVADLQGRIDSLRGKMVNVKISKAEKDRAAAEIRDFQNRIYRLQGRDVRITASAVYYGDGAVRRINANGTLGPIMRASGGRIDGPGTDTSDSVPAYLSRGEHVLSAREVRGAGGHSAVESMRQQWRGAPGYAAGGAVGAVDRSISRFTHLLTDRLVKNLDMLGGGRVSGWLNMWRVLHAAFPGAQLHSGFRLGAVTRSGNTSYHAMGRAIDVTPSMAIFNWIAARYGRNSAELIYSPAGPRQLHHGRPHYYSGGVRADHWDHVHWAMDRGGIANGMGYFAKRTGAPERVLSPAQTRSFDRLVSVIGAQGGSAKVEVHNHFPNYVGSRDDLRRALQAMESGGELDFIARRRVA